MIEWILHGRRNWNLQTRLNYAISQSGSPPLPMKDSLERFVVANKLQFFSSGASNNFTLYNKCLVDWIVEFRHENSGFGVVIPGDSSHEER